VIKRVSENLKVIKEAGRPASGALCWYAVVGVVGGACGLRAAWLRRLRAAGQRAVAALCAAHSLSCAARRAVALARSCGERVRPRREGAEQ